MNNQIRLSHIQFMDVKVKAKTFDSDITKDLNTSLGVGSLFDENNVRQFRIIFDVVLVSPQKKFKLKIKAIAHFVTTEDIDDTFKGSMFVEANAPAIAFPYIRSFISNLTLNSGYNPIMLPAYNFVTLAEDKKNKQNQFKKL